MSEAKKRIVLAFYTGSEGYAEPAFRALRSKDFSCQYFHGDGATEGSVSSRLEFSRLRLNGEELVIVEVDRAEVPAVVKTLRTSGEPSVFFGSPPPDRTLRSPASHSARTEPTCNWR